MLDNETVADSGSIQWLDGEDAFVILDQNKFEKVCSAKVFALLIPTPDALSVRTYIILSCISSHCLSFLLFLYQDIIPKYFTPIIFQSFLRKLYRWGFKRITTTHAGSYKFASATFTRRPAPNINITLNGTEGPAGIAVGSAGQAPFLPGANDSALTMLLRQQSAANAQPNQLYLSLQAQLHQSLQPAVTQDNHLIAVLANAIAQQTLPQIQLQQQMNQNQTNTILQSLLAQQLVNQSVLHSLPSSVFPPAPIHNPMMSFLGTASQNPLASLLNRNQVQNAYASTPSTVPSSGQSLSLLMNGIQNAITATAASGTAYQGPGGATGTTKSSSSNGTGVPRNMSPQRQSDSSSAQPQSRRKRKKKHPHPPPS